MGVIERGQTSHAAMRHGCDPVQDSRAQVNAAREAIPQTDAMPGFKRHGSSALARRRFAVTATGLRV